MADITETIKHNFGRSTVLIIGDLVADQYLNGTISRVSREAPVFILSHDETSTLPGAAANAAANVASLGGKPLVVGLIGDDHNGSLLLTRMQDAGIDCSYVVTDATISTTTKVRILAGQQHATRQQVIRVDYENKAAIGAEIRKKLYDNAIEAVQTADAVIVSDYNYGVAEASLFSAVLGVAREQNIPVIVDSRFRLPDFEHATSATPNQEEAEQILGPGFGADDCARLRERLGLEALLVTNGNRGMLLFEHGQVPKQIDAVGSAQAVDVTGAGDAVIAAYALALASGLGHFEAANVANHAGGLVVMKKGTAVVGREELIASIKSVDLPHQLNAAT